MVNNILKSGLLKWIKTTMINEGMIAEEDLRIFEVVDEPEEAVEIIKRRVVI